MPGAVDAVRALREQGRSVVVHTARITASTTASPRTCPPAASLWTVSSAASQAARSTWTTARCGSPVIGRPCSERR